MRLVPNKVLSMRDRSSVMQLSKWNLFLSYIIDPWCWLEERKDKLSLAKTFSPYQKTWTKESEESWEAKKEEEKAN